MVSVPALLSVRWFRITAPPLIAIDPPGAICVTPLPRITPPVQVRLARFQDPTPSRVPPLMVNGPLSCDAAAVTRLPPERMMLLLVEVVRLWKLFVPVETVTMTASVEI